MCESSTFDIRHTQRHDFMTLDKGYTVLYGSNGRVREKKGQKGEKLGGERKIWGKLGGCSST